MVGGARFGGRVGALDIVVRRRHHRSYPPRLRCLHRLAEVTVRHHPDDPAFDRSVPSHGAGPAGRD